MQILQSNQSFGLKIKRKNNILFVSDKGYFPYLNLVIASFLRYNEGDYAFHVFTMNDASNSQTALDFEDFQNLMRLKSEYHDGDIDFTIYNLTDEYNQRFPDCVNDPGCWTKYASLRLLSPFILRDIPEILYLDCDLLVVTNLQPYFNLCDFERYDIFSATYTNEITETSYTSFCLYLNLDQLRINRKAEKILQKFNTVVYPTYDMGVLNDCDLLFYPASTQEPCTSKEIGVIHFCGSEKKLKIENVIKDYDFIHINDIDDIKSYFIKTP